MHFKHNLSPHIVLTGSLIELDVLVTVTDPVCLNILVSRSVPNCLLTLVYKRKRQKLFV